MQGRSVRDRWIAFPIVVALLASAAACGGRSDDPCSGIGCSSRGYCIADQGAAYCACMSGFHPVLLACEPNDPGDPCRDVGCTGHGRCILAAGSPECVCESGYHHPDDYVLQCVADLVDGPPDTGPCVPAGPETCNLRDDDCDGLTDEDFDTDFDDANCGRCGLACADSDHAHGTCILGGCDVTCDPGRSNLDGDPGNGCESTCSPAGSDETRCDGADDDCDGVTDAEERAKLPTFATRWHGNSRAERHPHPAFSRTASTRLRHSLARGRARLPGTPWSTGRVRGSEAMPVAHRWSRPTLVVVLPALALFGASGGCYGSLAEHADGEDPDGSAGEDSVSTEGHADAASDIEAGAEAAADRGPEADDDTGTEAGDDVSDETPAACPEGWSDPSNGQCWQASPADGRLDWREGVDYCESLSLDGLPAGTWHLPTISELRSMVRGCPDAMTGGACRVTDSCLSRSCTSAACSSCDYLGGPGADGCYWDAALDGACTWYWSSSTFAGSSSYAWAVDFYDGSVFSVIKTNSRNVRCIRREP